MQSGLIGSWRPPLASLFLVFAGLCSAAEAQVGHRFRLSAAPVVHVWENGSPVGKGGSVSLGQAGTDRTPGAPDLVVTGKLVPVSFAAPSRNPSRPFQVASNAPFSIEIACHGLNQPGTTSIQIEISGTGPGAQIPGPATGFVRLSREAPSSVLYRASSRTAKTPGSPLDQSIQFNLHSPDGGLDLSACRLDITADK